MALETPPTATFWMCGVLRAEDGDDLVGLALHVEGLQVVRHGEQVHFRRQLHRRVAPVAVGEDAELAAVDEALQALLDGAHLELAVAGCQEDRLSASFEVASGSAFSAETTSTQSSAERW
jgi:hypothetical protein